MRSSQPDPSAANLMARNIVLANGVRMTQQIYTNTFDPDNLSVLNIPVRNVGLIQGFLVQITGGVTNGAATQADRTGFGSANAIQNITFTDLNNVQRINTTGYHLAMLNSARQGFGFGGAYAPNLPMSYGNNWAPFAATNPIAATNTGTVSHVWWVPIAYSSMDLRGAIYAAVVNATMNLQLTISTSAQMATLNGDPLTFVYTGNDNLAWTGNVTVTVYQVYLDQIPKTNQGVPVLPMMDLNTIYDIKYTTLTGMAAAQDFPVPYANFRQFLSTFAIYDNAGVFNVGTDVNYFALQAANSVNIFRVTPNIAALQARQTFMADPPPGVYYFDHRDRPIDTLSYGNQELVLNASAVTAGASLIMGYEAFQQVNQIPLATSLAAGG